MIDSSRDMEGTSLNEGRRPEYFSERWPHLVEDGGKSKKPMLESCSGCGTVVSSSRTHAEAARADVMKILMELSIQLFLARHIPYMGCA